MQQATASFYRRPQSRQAYTWLPAPHPRRWLLGEKDSRQVPRLRALVRPRRAAGEVPGAEGQPARRPPTPGVRRRRYGQV